MSPRLQLQVERSQYAPGDVVKGTVLVVEGGSSRSLEAVLLYNEETSDYSEVAISISSGPLKEGDLTAGASYDFELPLPPDALPNYASGHGALYWEVDARSDEFGRDTHARSRIEVERPRGPPTDGFAETEPSGGLPARAAPSTGKRRPGSRRRGSDGLFRWLVLGFLAVGIVALVIGMVTLVRTVQFVQRAEHAPGTVIDLSRETDSEGEVTFYPVVRFTTAEGKEIEFKSSSGSSPPSQSEGDRVDVLYDPDDPNDARLSGIFDLWLFPIVSFALGAAFLAVTFFVRRQSSSEP